MIFTVIKVVVVVALTALALCAAVAGVAIFCLVLHDHYTCHMTKDLDNSPMV